ncbi:uncharacterized protein LOC117611629 [Osmia lignaria lignaria]|uniref:uncharacterized protein LOC117611629 n=1 Tax=Osmia lignaria lignaria TaxID=1437193 RepID=UPI00402B3186
MNCVYLLLLSTVQLTAVYCANENYIIRDYFAFRKVGRIVGFSCDNVENDFKLAKTLNGMYTTYISMSNSTIESRLDVKKLLTAEYHQLGVFLDCRCDPQRYIKVIADAGKYSMYDEMHKWLILGSDLRQTLEILNDDTFSVSTDVVIVIPSNDNYLLYDVYNPCKDRGGSMNVTYFGSWSSESRLNVSLNQSKFQRRSNLHGMKLKVGVVLNIKVENKSLDETMLEYSMKSKYGRSKFLYVLLHHLSDLFNFTMDLVQINAQRRFDNSGPVFTAFKKKLIDMSASPVAMKIDRLTNGDIIGPVWPIRSCFIFRTISSSKMKPTQFLQPLSMKVWYVIFATIGMVTIILIILIRMEGIRSPTEIYGLSVLLTIGAISQQGSAFIPNRFAGRIALLHTLLFSVLILNYYSASIVSNRLKNKGERMNDSLISLAKSNMKLAAESTPYIRSFLKVPDKEVRYFYENRWMKIPEFSRYLPLEEGLDRVADGSLAYHTMIDSAYPYIEQSFNYRSICELTEVHLFRSILAFYARHKSPFTELMKIGLTKIRNVGIQKRELKRWRSRKPFCPNNLLIAEPLSIHEAAPVFIFLSFSMFLSLLFCLVENLLFYLSSARRESALMEKKHLIGRNFDLSTLKDVNLQTSRNFNHQVYHAGGFNPTITKIVKNLLVTMSIIFLLLLQFILISNAQDHIFIRDYFVHKKVRNVVGFSCGDTIGDFNLLKTLSTIGIFTIIREPSMKIDFRRFLRSETWTVGVVIDVRCHNETAVRIFAESSKHRMYDYSYNWLVLGSNYNRSIPLLNDTAYNIVTDLVLAISNKHGYDLYDVFNHCKYRGGLLNVTKLGTWRQDSGLNIVLTQPLINRRANMHGMRLKISGVIQYRPKDMRLEDYMQDINTRSLDSMHKFVHAMMLHTGDLFNFSVHASEIIYWDRHSVHGLIFEFLRSNYIDFASNPRIMVSERLDFASLIGAAWPIKPCFMLLSTSTNKIKLEIFLKPFTRQTWYVFAAFGIFSIFIMKLIMNREKVGKREKYSGAVVLSIGIIAQQGANFLPKRVPSRIALFQITLHSWIMYNYYSASIVSARLSEPLDMMEDSVTVLADSNLKIAAEAVPYLNYFLYKLNWESDYFRKKRWDPLPESKRYLPLEEGIRQVSQGILAYHTDPNTAYPYVERMFDSNKICELTEIHLFKQSVMGMYASHNGQFIEIAKIGLTKMFNTGLRNRQIKHWSSRKPQCQPDTLSTRSITIYETAPALLLLAFGIIVAGTICIVENIIFNRSMRKMDINQKKRIGTRGSIASGNSRDNLLDLNH